MTLNLFQNDKNLVHGEVSIENSLVPPAEFGTYSIRLPQDLDQEKLKVVKVILWSCMDRRIVRPLYNQLLQQGYQDEEILTISMGGGPVQVGDDRVNALKSAFNELTNTLPVLEKVWAVAHTGVCGGIKHFCGGTPIVEVAKQEYLDQAKQHQIDAEIYVTDLLLEGCFDILPQSFIAKTTLAIAAPDEAKQTVTIHPHQVREKHTLTEVIQ
ncbi:hypothetical protein C4579_02635 [Candidatus Microgenomates bacterium]|nr:MAG: hypothetical protein C4579_02635 [Candidatus Microgenomates bacterium]